MGYSGNGYWVWRLESGISHSVCHDSYSLLSPVLLLSSSFGPGDQSQFMLLN